MADEVLAAAQDGTESAAAPLAGLRGAIPQAPDWFRRALQMLPESGTQPVDGAAIDWLAWGRRGAPGLLLCHGNGAHAGWWRHIAPFFAETHRVVALSWSGMGRSEHRPPGGYSAAGFAGEAVAVAEAAGLFEADIKPDVLAHSFGGFIMLTLLNGPHGERFRRGTILDTPVRRPNADDPRRRMRAGQREGIRPHRVYPDLASALARFRLAPPQGCAHLFIADMIARESLVEVPGGFTWAFDPTLWQDFKLDDPAPLLSGARCPLVLMWGDRSGLMPADVIADMRRLLPPDTPAIAIPDADHHVMIDQPLALVAALRAMLA